MMGGGNIAQNLLDLLNEPERFKAHLEELNKATAARNESADNHRRAKREAEEAITLLNAKRASHEAREHEIGQMRAETEQIRHRLGSELALTKAKQYELDQARQTLQSERANHQASVGQFATRVAEQQQSINQQRLHLEQKLMEAAERHRDLDKREAHVGVREKFLISAAHEITRAR